jgi:hypothetical protein
MAIQVKYVNTIMFQGVQPLINPYVQSFCHLSMDFTIIQVWE